MAVILGRLGKTHLLRALFYLVPVSVLCSIWIPDFHYYHVPGLTVRDELIAQSRVQPAFSVLAEVEQTHLGPYRRILDRRELLASAEALLRGELELHPYPSRRFAVSFFADDLSVPAAQLAFASLIVPDVFLDAYAATRDERFYLAAREFVLAFAKYEKSAWRPKGMLWNDHAIAARIPVLVKFWRVYRERSDFDSNLAAAVLELAVRSGQFLAKPTHFTYRTNHGVMQNVGLLALCIAFPALSDAAAWCDLAVKRLDDQMQYYVNDEGLVLEHSAGYHAFGVDLLSTILRALTLLNRPIPPGWEEKYGKAKAYYAALRRPDGTLPMYGDTHSTATSSLVADADKDGRYSMLHARSAWRPESSFNLFPVAGQAIWWKNLDAWPQTLNLSQTVVSWGNFPSQAHKLADEMSLIFWRNGQTWITNSGYWPFGVWGRGHAAGWEGSNSPHLAGEPASSSRRTDLLGYVDSNELTLLDLARHRPDGYTSRRQVIQLGSGTLLVLDHVQDRAPRRSTTVWTMDPALQLVPRDVAGAYRVVSRGTSSVMSMLLLTSEGASIKSYSGSRSPFAGWVVTDEVPRAAPAIVVEQPSEDSWSLVVWSLEESDAGAARLLATRMLKWTNADEWSVGVEGPDHSLIIERADRQLWLRGANRDEPVQMRIAQPVDPSAKRMTIAASFEQAKAQSRKFRELAWYRLKLTYFLLAIFVLQEAAFFFLRRLPKSYLIGARSASSVAWIAGCVWIQSHLLI